MLLIVLFAVAAAVNLIAAVVDAWHTKKWPGRSVEALTISIALLLACVLVF